MPEKSEKKEKREKALETQETTETSGKSEKKEKKEKVLELSFQVSFRSLTFALVTFHVARMFLCSSFFDAGCGVRCCPSIWDLDGHAD